MSDRPEQHAYGGRMCRLARPAAWVVSCLLRGHFPAFRGREQHLHYLHLGMELSLPWKESFSKWRKGRSAGTKHILDWRSGRCRTRVVLVWRDRRSHAGPSRRLKTLHNNRHPTCASYKEAVVPIKCSEDGGTLRNGGAETAATLDVPRKCGMAGARPSLRLQTHPR